ncbi:MAG: hypothetical protein Udaeo2_02470 [Candidatus Udaeobacter sp.]|nr:MAG: hypothetical protein Udaeo2_02470 [Candidatus Udaeobacter sp.]
MASFPVLSLIATSADAPALYVGGGCSGVVTVVWRVVVVVNGACSRFLQRWWGPSGGSGSGGAVVCGGGGAVVAVVWRVVVLVVSGVLEQDTSIKPRTESAEPSMIALFINIYCLILSFANL